MLVHTRTYSASLLSDVCNFQLNGKGGLKSWQWVFLIEGLMSIAMALPISFILLSFPETSTALSERGKLLIFLEVCLMW